MTQVLLRLRSFRTQSAVIFGGLVIALAAALSAAFGALLAGQIHADEGKALQVIASNAALSLSFGMTQRSREVEVLAKDESLWREGLDSDYVRQTIERLKTARAHSAWIGVADTTGVVRASTGGLLEGASVASRPWFKLGISGTHIGDVHDAKLLAKLLPAAADGGPLRFVDFASPIYVDGEIVGIVAMHGSWDWARATLEALVPAVEGNSHLQVLILDSAGKVISAPAGLQIADVSDAESLMRAASNAREAGYSAVRRWDDGVSYLTAASSVRVASSPDLGWTVVVREPISVAFAGARRSVWLALAIGVGGASIAVFLAWLLSGIFSTPLAAIARAARDVENGHQDAEIPEFNNNAELSRLSTALSSMTRRLLAANQKLEARVRERTAELEAANAALEKLARHDPLTGLMNRRAFEERIGQTLAAAKRSGAPVSLLMVDADHFKSVNDRFGHETGDDVLKSLAATLKTRVRETDFVARMGGEEFAVVLPDTDEAGAMLVARSLVERMASTDMPVAGKVTISVGAASMAWAPDAQKVLMRAADAALYEAKRAGRNQACQAKRLHPVQALAA